MAPSSTGLRRPTARVLALFVPLFYALVVASGCHKRQSIPPPHPVLRVTLAFGPFARRLIQEFRTALPTVDVQAVSATDSNDTVRALEHGHADFGLAYADAVFSAYSANGGGVRTGQLRGVSLLEPLPMYFLVRTASGITQASDIRGRNVAIPGGPASLANWTLGGLVLQALGVDPASVKTLPVQTVLEGLTDGSLDAVLLSGWTPATAAAVSNIRAKVTLVPVEGPSIERLRREYPFIRSVVVPLVLYPEQQHPIATVGMDVLVICRSDLDEALVHDAIKVLFVVYPRLSDVEATLRFLNLDEAPATPIPLHPGAARYFRERELSR
jgi:hypothetical protein